MPTGRRDPVVLPEANSSALRRPRLVPLEPTQVDLEDGTSGFVLRDPYGILENTALVTPAAYFVLAHFDGRRDLEEVVKALLAAGLKVRLSDVERVATQALEAGLVHGPVYEARRKEVLTAYRAGPRAPACAGGSYPDDAAELREMLAGFYEHPEGPGRKNGSPRAGRSVGLLVAPHIDFRRGGPAYAHAYRALEGTSAELYVVFGTAHASPPHLFTLTRQDFDTPLGRVATDRSVVDALAEELGEEEVFADEIVHVREHSCEFQMVWLRSVLGDQPFRVLPVLCSSISHLEDPAAATDRFLKALARVVAGKKVCCVAGADLAHVGPQYGDPRAPTRAELSKLGEEDRRTLAFVTGGDCPGFHRDAVTGDERRRLCGVAPIYAAMRTSERGAKVLYYGQWTDGTDMVSFAAAAG